MASPTPARRYDRLTDRAVARDVLKRHHLNRFGVTSDQVSETLRVHGMDVIMMMDLLQLAAASIPLIEQPFEPVVLRPAEHSLANLENRRYLIRSQPRHDAAIVQHQRPGAAQDQAAGMEDGKTGEDARKPAGKKRTKHPGLEELAREHAQELIEHVGETATIGDG